MRVLTAVADTVFPAVCVACHHAEPGAYGLCAGCEAQVPPVPAPACPGCGGALDTALDLCTECLQHPRPWEFAVSCCRFRDLARRLIHRYKYEGDVALARLFATRAVAAWRAAAPNGADRLVVPVPLHWFKQWRRGYNQSELIARLVATMIGTDCLPVLRRSRWTKSQTRLDFEQRRRNLRNVFKTRKEALVSGRHILLVDDVLTTGATLDACTRVLLDAGAADVAVLTVARG